MTAMTDLDPSEGIALYSDGSCWAQDRSGAYAWLALDAFDGEHEGYGRVTDTTNNQMEMMAWIEGLKAIYQAFGPCQVIVYSDSQYVGRGAIDRKRQRRANVDLWSQLDQMIDQHLYVEFFYIKGHSGDKYNHRVDELANRIRKQSE